MLPSLLGLAAAGVSWLLTGLVRRYAIWRDMWDLPNSRSSHLYPIPRGGGVAIAAVALLGVSALLLMGKVAPRETLGLVGGGILVAVVGWLDDRQGLSTAIRAVCHGLAAGWLVLWVGGLPTLRLGLAHVELGPAGSVLAVLAIAWSINSYNFMDGIDGLAGGQAVVAATVATALLAAPMPGLALVSVLIAGASLGFLVWNWSPARIFMGDVGSGLLGFLFAALALLSERGGGPPLVSWLLFGGVFLFDATVTLIRRIATGERWYAAHRSHAYQRAVQSGWSHAQVSAGVIALSVVLSLLGVAVARRPELLLPCVGAALAVLTVCYLWIEKRLPMRRESDKR